MGHTDVVESPPPPYIPIHLANWSHLGGPEGWGGFFFWCALAILMVGCGSQEGWNELGHAGLSQQALRAALGADCTRDANCGANMRCFGSQCLCEAGLLACRGSCCDEGQVCQEGVCTAPPPAPPSPLTIGTEQDVDGVDNQTMCGFYSEARFTHTWNAYPYSWANFQDSDNGASGPYLPLKPWLYNWRSAGTNGAWSTQRGWGASGFTFSSDPWSTTSGSTGLEYASIMGANASGSCIGIAATSFTNLQNGIWTYPVDCAIPPGGNADDGPKIVFDPGGTNLFASSKRLDGGPACPAGATCTACQGGATSCARLYIWRNCGVGHPTYGNPSAPCNLTNSVGLPNSTQHAMVAVNPATHNPMVAYKDTSASTSVHLAIVNKDTGGVISNTVAEPNALLGPVTGPGGSCANSCPDPVTHASSCTGPCTGTNTATAFIPKCGGCTSTDCGGPGCMRMTDNVYISVVSFPAGYPTYGGKQYAYLAFSYRCGSNGGDGFLHVKSVVRIVDVTNEVTPTVLNYKQSTPCTTSWNDNDFEPVALAQVFPSVPAFEFAWGYYRQYQGDPCNTLFEVDTASDPVLSTLTQSGTVAIGPSLRIGDGHGIDLFNQVNAAMGLGDYITGEFLPAGDTLRAYFVYPHAVTLTAPNAPNNCPGTHKGAVLCQGSYRSLGMYGVFGP